MNIQIGVTHKFRVIQEQGKVNVAVIDSSGNGHILFYAQVPYHVESSLELSACLEKFVEHTNDKSYPNN